MPKRPNDYTSRGWQVACTTLLVLLVISFIPPITLGGVELRRASIISDLIDHNAGEEASQTQLAELPEIDVKEFEVDLIEVAQKVAETTATASPMGEATSASWEGIFDEQPSGGDYAANNAQMPAMDSIPLADYSDILPTDSLIISIEEFYEGEGDSPMSQLYEKLLAGKSNVRVAFMGDSFVEGDILTADLRELMQDSFHGLGVGFVPVASPFTGFRQTIKTQSSGWTPYNIMQLKNVPAPYSNDFFVSGWVAQASEGASTRWDMTERRRHLQECRRVRLLFISREESVVSIKLNDGEERTFSFDGDEVVRQIVIEEPSIRSLEMKVIRGAKGFTAIGAEFDDKQGVSIDNLSIRSNNGQAMFRSNPSVNAQINTMRQYDLVVLQYGLNIMQAERTNYSLYAEQVEKMIRYVRSCFPEAAVLVMGVSDRSQKNEQGITPMLSAIDLTEWQRTAARNCGAAFWNTYEAMQRKGGMKEFVNQNWAGKDYTHINYAGGREIARELYYAFLQGAQNYSRAWREKVERQQPIITEPLEGINPLHNDSITLENPLRDSLTHKVVNTEQNAAQ
ncbi:MAG: hypothetical protein J5989_05690 [Alistipes sp.]|nr:hypothetical protein [Alistipes sp.]MBR7096267.1 hypothetical protein [Alistipes sp.]